MLKKNLSFYQLAIDADLERGTIKNWFSGAEPSVKALEKVADALGVTIAQLYAIDNVMEISESSKQHLLHYEMLSDDDKNAIDKYIDALNFISTHNTNP